MSEPRRPALMQHNPGFLAPNELLASFLARKAELESLLDTLRHNDRASNQHVLILGRRGMGKTMLVRRLVLAIERDAELARRWYPIVFGEEAYNVATAGELWLEALHQLAEQTGDPRWRRAHVELRREREDRRLHDLALTRLLDFADERGVRLVLAVENLQDLLAKQMSDDEGWVLRHTLLNEPRIMLLASATSRFDDIDQPKKAFYELFATLQLETLTRDEIRDIWAHFVGERLEGLRVRPLEIFTGGSPRLLTLLARFAKGHTLHDFMANLLRLIDANTDYFKSNIEALSLDERRVFMALCELWEPSPARDVAEVARFDVSKTSMLLGRLVGRGAAEIVQVRGRVQYYQCAERLYNLYHRLRNRSDGDGRAQGIVDFMLQYYSREDIGSLVRRGAKEVVEHEEGREDVLPVIKALMLRMDGWRLALMRLPDAFAQYVDRAPAPSREESESLDTAPWYVSALVRYEQDAAAAEAHYRRALERQPSSRADAAALTSIIILQSRVPEAIAFAEDWQSIHGASRMLSLALVPVLESRRNLHSVVLQRIFGSAENIDATIAPIIYWSLALILADFAFESSRMIPIAKAMLEQELVNPYHDEWMLSIGECLDSSRHSTVVQMVEEVDNRHPQRIYPRHVKRALDAKENERAFVLLEQVLESALSSGWLLGAGRPTLLRLALIDPERLHTLLAPHPLFEPFTFALAQELGHDVLAPHEVMEIAKDIRAELHALRGSDSPYVVAPTSFAHAAERAPSRRKPTKRQSKKRTTKKPR